MYKLIFMKAFQILLLLLVFGLTSIAQKKEVKLNNNPIGVFDSGTGGLTVLEAMLTLDAFNNEAREMIDRDKILSEVKVSRFKDRIKKLQNHQNLKFYYISSYSPTTSVI